MILAAEAPTNLLQEYQTPYIVSNLVALVFLFFSFRLPNVTRVLLILLFLWASITNGIYAISSPEVYQGYAKTTPFPFVKEIVEGFFRQHTTLLVFSIAICQLAIAVGLLFDGRIRKLAVIGLIIFLIGICPLGIGAAFPFSVTLILAAWIMQRKLSHFQRH